MLNMVNAQMHFWMNFLDLLRQSWTRHMRTLSKHRASRWSIMLKGMPAQLHGAMPTKTATVTATTASETAAVVPVNATPAITAPKLAVAP